MPRELYIVGNWKMYKTAREAADYIAQLEPRVRNCKGKIYLAVPFTSIASAARAAKGSNISIGAQNVHDAREGAFTGEISSLMLKEAGAEFVILGHSERRTLFGETDFTIREKVVRALQDDLQPILCVGETLEERSGAGAQEVLKRQIHACLAGIPTEDVERVVLAYEPIWAIGTGKTASPKMAQESHAYCRLVVAELLGKKIAEHMSILYGGSVKPENGGSLTAQKDIDGVLVGGASLDPEAFAEIAHNCESKQ